MNGTIRSGASDSAPQRVRLPILDPMQRTWRYRATVISVDNLALGRKAMRVQTGPEGRPLNLAPKFLIVPATLESACVSRNTCAGCGAVISGLRS